MAFLKMIMPVAGGLALVVAAPAMAQGASSSNTAGQCVARDGHKGTWSMDGAGKWLKCRKSGNLAQATPKVAAKNGFLPLGLGAAALAGGGAAVATGTGGSASP